MTVMLTIARIVWLDIIRRKDVYVLLILLGTLLVTLVFLDVFGLGGLVVYVKDAGLLMAWMFSWILAVVISTRQLPREETRGTIFPLLAKPVSRLQLLLGKWIGAWTVAAFATLMFYGLVVLVVVLKGGAFYPACLLQGCLLHGVAIGVIAALGLACSTRMNHDAAASIAFVLTGVSFLIVPRVPEFLTRETGFSAGMLLFLYNLFPHFELFDLRQRIVHGYGPVGGGLFGALVLYGLLQMSLFVLVAWLAYRHRRFTRSAGE